MNRFRRRAFLSLLIMGILVTFSRGNSDAEITDPMAGEKVFAIMEAGNEQTYLNERVSLTVKLFSVEHSLKDIQYPRLFHPDFVTQEFESPVRKIETRNGMEFETLEFRTTLFGLKTGRFKLGPARLGATLVMGPGWAEKPSLSRNPKEEYFGAPETRPVGIESNELTIRVLPLPGRGRPEKYGGAVGSFEMAAEIHPAEVEAGEPITLRITLSGDGNFDRLAPPTLEYAEGFRVYAGQGKQGEGFRIYEQVLIPESNEVTEVPAIRFSFFDPKRTRYHTLSRGPFPIKVRKPGKGEAFAGELLPLRKSPGRVKSRGDLLYRNRLYLLLHLLAPFFLLALWLRHRRGERIRKDVKYARQIEARKWARKGLREAERILKRGNSKEFYGFLSMSLREYLGNQFNLPSKSMTADGVDHILKSDGVDEKDLMKIRALFCRCDLARYGRAEFDEAGRGDDFRMLREVLSRLAGKRPEGESRQ